MKTSNKILLAITSIIGLSLLSVLIFAKSSLINVENGTVIGDGKVIKVDYNIGEISFFNFNGDYDIYVKKGEPQLIIETDENIQAFLNPSDDNFTYTYKGENSEPVLKRMLRIGRMNDVDLKPTKNIKIYLTTPMIENVNISGKSKVTFEDTFSSESFKAEISDNAALDLKISTDKLDVNADGHSKFNFSGTAGNTTIEARSFSEISIKSVNAQSVSIESNNDSKLDIHGSSQFFTINASGSTKINAEGLVAQEATVIAEAQSDLTLSTAKTLKVEATGSANIKYKGTPEITKTLSDQASLSPVE